MSERKDDKSTWPVGGGLMLGLGVGFFFFETSIFAFVGCIMAGIGLGLMVAAFMARKQGE